MRFVPAQDGSRREFFRAAARYGLLGVIAAAAGFLGRKRAQGQARCVARSLCGQCLAFTDCQLPPARSAREQRERILGR